MRIVGVLTGLAAEARLLDGHGGDGALIVACTGADPRRAREEAGQLVSQGATALVSFGLAGGLCPSLRAGDLVCAERVVLPGGLAVAVDADWRRAVLARAQPLRDALGGAMAGVDRLLVTTEEKCLAAASGAVAADMESHAVALAAEEAGVPFIVLRAVSDPAGRALPSVARVALKPGGRVDAQAVAMALVRRPSEWPAVARLALDTRAAMATLRGAVGVGALLAP